MFLTAFSIFFTRDFMFLCFTNILMSSANLDISMSFGMSFCIFLTYLEYNIGLSTSPWETPRCIKRVVSLWDMTACLSYLTNFTMHLEHPIAFIYSAKCHNWFCWKPMRCLGRLLRSIVYLICHAFDSIGPVVLVCICLVIVSIYGSPIWCWETFTVPWFKGYVELCITEIFQ